MNQDKPALDINKDRYAIEYLQLTGYKDFKWWCVVDKVENAVIWYGFTERDMKLKLKEILDERN
jgi:hypothetical protein